MQSLKKYFTEGLIQVAILLSLAGIRVDVDHYLPPLSEIIQGQSSALTQTQFHNLQNSLEGYSLHPKSRDLDGFFTTRRLLRWVRSLDHLQVPAAQLETWLVHREPNNSVTTIQGQAGALEAADGLVDMENSSLTIRMGGEMAELGYSAVGEENLGNMSRFSRGQMDNEDIKEEADELSFWQQESNHNIHQQQLPQEYYQHLFNEDNDNEFMVDSWRNATPFYNQMGSILGEDVQLAGLGESTSFSFDESLQLLESNLPLGDQHHLGDADVESMDEDPLQHHRSLLSPMLPQHESLLDVEQQWQDVLFFMDPQDKNVNDTHLNVSLREGPRETEYMKNPIQHDTSVHQTELQSCSQVSSASRSTSNEDQSNQNQTVSGSSSSTDFPLNDSDIIDFLLSSAPDSPIYSSHNAPSSSMEEQDLSSLFGPLLEEAMFEEISLLDLALEEGFSQSQVFQSEEQDPTDSDSGLSLDFSQSPASPSGSESSSSSSSSSCSSSSMSSIESAPEEGAAGYNYIKEELTGEEQEEEGAAGGYCPEQNKMSHLNYLQATCFHHLPTLEHVGHDHTYNQPQCVTQRNAPKQCQDEPVEHSMHDKFSSRDEKRARAMKIPFSNDHIINLPVEEFNELLAKHHLSEAQLTLIRDIRRRGKNKMAAQHCRQRKLHVLVGLERNVDGLRRHRARLLREKSEVSRSVREMKQRLNDLYQEVYSLLREEQGMLCSASDFVLQQGSDNHMPFSAHYSSESRRKSGKRQKDKE